MNNKISNKVIHDKLHSEYIPEETKNTLSNSKNNEQQTINKSILNKNKKPFYNKKQKNVSIGINLEKLIINKRKNNNINISNNQLDQINRNLSYNSIVSNKKNINQNNSLSTLSKSNKKPDGLKNLKHSTTNFNCNNNNVINKGKTYFIKNLDMTEETLEPSLSSGSKVFNKSIMNNNIPRIYEKQKILQNSSLLIKNNSFANPNTNNNALIPPQRIKNCYTNLNINKNDSNRKKNKLKGIPFSLKKNKPKINTILQNNINNIELKLENSEENIRPIYKNEKLLQKKKNIINNKGLSIKVGNNNKDIFLTEKNNNENLKKSFCNSDIKKSFFNDLNYKRISPLAKNGIYISPSKQGLEFIDNKSFKIVRKLDLGQNIDEESKKDMDVKFLDENNVKIGKIFSKVSKVKILHDNQKKKVMSKNNKLNNKSTNINSNNNGNNGNNNMNINNEKIDIKNNKINNPKMQKNKSANIIKKNFENQQKSKIENKPKIKVSVENHKNNTGNNNNSNIINPISESEKNNEEDEDIDTIEDSLKSSNHIISIHIFKTSNIYLSKTNIISCLKLLPKILNLEKFIRLAIHFCDLNTLNKICLISKKYYKCIKPIINKIIMEKVYNYNKNNKNKYKNKIKSSLLKFSSLSEISKTLLEKKYKDLLFENNCIYDEQIKKDLTRTLPGNISFQYGNENYNKLYHLLTAYANYNKNIGYAQGLNFLAANSIFIFEKEMDEFLFLDALIQKFNLENIIGLSNNLSIKLEEISNCLNKYFPKIKKYLESMNLNYEFFLAGWVLTLFSNSINNEYLFYIWDFMIIFGWNYFNCFIIAVLKKYENEILSLPQNKLTFYMKNILKNDSFQKDFETIMKSSFEFL